MRRYIAFLGLSVLAVLANAAGKQPITGADVLKIRNVTSVAVASDGSFAVYGVQSIHTDSPTDPKGEPAYKYRTHLWRIDLDNPNSRPEQLTFGDRSDSLPAISPDNRTLAFVRVDTVGTRPRPQVWLLSLRGPGEVRFWVYAGSGSGPINCASIRRCSMSACASSREGGSTLFATFVVGSEDTRFSVAMNTHAQARPAQIRRLGKTNSRQSFQPAARKTFSGAGVCSDRNSVERFSVHIRSSFGSIG